MRGEDLQVDGLVADPLRAWRGGGSMVSLTAWQSVSSQSGGEPPKGVVAFSKVRN